MVSLSANNSGERGPDKSPDGGTTNYLVDNLRDTSYIDATKRSIEFERSFRMPPRKSDNPTDAELEILRVLWDNGPCTVRSVYESLCEYRNVGYTTVLKVMQIMFDKGFVIRDESRRSHVYEAKLERDVAQRQLVKVLVDKAFGGSSDQLVLQALNTKKLTSKEIAEVRRLLDEMEG